MDFSLSEQEKMLQNLAKDFAEKEVLPRASEIDRTGQFPVDLARELGSRGFRGLPYPVKYGGSGAGYVSFVLVVEQLCQASMTVGAIVSVNTVPEEGIYRFGNEEQKSHYNLLREIGLVGFMSDLKSGRRARKCSEKHYLKLVI